MVLGVMSTVNVECAGGVRRGERKPAVAVRDRCFLFARAKPGLILVSFPVHWHCPAACVFARVHLLSREALYIVCNCVCASQVRPGRPK